MSHKKALELFGSFQGSSDENENVLINKFIIGSQLFIKLKNKKLN